MKAAAIDIGTNSVKVSIGEIVDGAIRVTMESAKVTRLGANVDSTHRIQTENADHTVEAIAGFCAIAREHGVTSITSVGTSALRDADNGPEFVSRVKNECGIDVEIVAGQREAELALRSVTSDHNLINALPSNLIVFDIGGGSTEIISGKDGKLAKSGSLDIGAVRLTDRILKSSPVLPEQVLGARTVIRTALEDVGIEAAKQAIVGIGGTAVTAAAVLQGISYKETDRLHGVAIDRDRIEDLINRIEVMNSDQIEKIPFMDPARADIILGGLLILQELLVKFESEAFTLSTKGVRFALLCEQLDAN